MTITTFGPYALTWLAVQRRRRTRRPATCAAYDCYLRRHIVPVLGDLPLSALRRKDLRAFAELLDEAGLGAATIRHILHLCHTILAHAVDAELIGANPAAGLGRPWRAGQGTPLDRADQVAFVAALGGRDGPAADVFRVMLEAGTRIGETLALRAPDVDVAGAAIEVARTWRRGQLGPPKGIGGARLVDVPERTVALLGARLAQADGGWLFPNPATGRPYDQKSITEAFRRYAAIAELTAGRYTPHSLRHTYATRLAEAGVDLAYIQQQLGHSTIEITRGLYARRARIPRPPGLTAALERVATRHAPHPASGAARAARHEATPLRRRDGGRQ
jgi:integrase